MEVPIFLPYHLYRTYHALKKIGGKGTAQQVSHRSGYARANESARLNVLAILGVVEKLRVKQKKGGPQVEFAIIRHAEPDFDRRSRVSK